MKSSFEGFQEVPVVYGMTIGEYALMINDVFLTGQIFSSLFLTGLQDRTV
jgi:uncharacterized protein YbbC (DUF1343 family)